MAKADLLQRASWAKDRGGYDVARNSELELLRELQREGKIALWCDVNGPLPVWKFTAKEAR